MAIRTRRRTKVLGDSNVINGVTNSVGVTTYKVNTDVNHGFFGLEYTRDDDANGWKNAQRVLRDNNISKFVERGIRHSDFGSAFDHSYNTYEDNMQMLSEVRNIAGSREFYFGKGLYPRAYQASTISSDWPVLSLKSDSALFALGGTAIARCSPTNPVASLSQAIGEVMKDGIPHLPGIQAMRQKGLRSLNLGDEFLNVEFGWAPFIRDIKSISSAIVRSHEIISQYKRDSGRFVRRSYAFPKAEADTHTVIGTSGNTGAPGDSVLFSGGKTDLVDRTTTEIWFSGAFTYFLDDGETAADRLEYHAQLARKVLGLDLTPETAWNLAPWSWAADWFANTGDIMRNVSAISLQDLIVRYGYIMCRQRRTKTYTLTGASVQTTGRKLGPFVQTFGTVTEQRRKASPYGFGLSFDGFSSTQLAILAALGMSRGQYGR